MEYTAPPPPYSAVRDTPRRSRACISTLPLHLLHRVVSLTLDPRATPSRFSADEKEEKVRRIWALFRGLRGVDRRFYLVSTSILRTRFLPTYTSLLSPRSSSDPYPIDNPDGSTRTTISTSVFAQRRRETAVFDRFVAVRVGEDLRKIESELYEESGAEEDIFRRLQPAARMEDLLYHLPRQLISPQSPSPSQHPPPSRLPLPHSHLVINLTPSWAQLYLLSHSIGSFPRVKIGRDLALEVTRQRDAEHTVRRIREGLEDVQMGLVSWGGRVS